MLHVFFFILRLKTFFSNPQVYQIGLIVGKHNGVRLSNSKQKTEAYYQLAQVYFPQVRFNGKCLERQPNLYQELN